MKSSIRISYLFDAEKMTVSPKAELTLQNGETVEFELPSGSISSETRPLCSKNCPFYFLSFLGKQIPIGFCPTGHITGYETHIFNGICNTVRAKARKTLADHGYKAKFENIGSNLILATY